MYVPNRFSSDSKDSKDASIYSHGKRYHVMDYSGNDGNVGIAKARQVSDIDVVHISGYGVRTNVLGGHFKNVTFYNNTDITMSASDSTFEECTFTGVLMPGQCCLEKCDIYCIGDLPGWQNIRKCNIKYVLLDASDAERVSFSIFDSRNSIQQYVYCLDYIHTEECFDNIRFLLKTICNVKIVGIAETITSFIKGKVYFTSIESSFQEVCDYVQE